MKKLFIPPSRRPPRCIGVDECIKSSLRRDVPALEAGQAAPQGRSSWCHGLPAMQAYSWGFIIAVLFLFSSGAAARDFTTVSGETISSQDIDSQGNTVLLFWTTWCPYCAVQVKAFNNYCDELVDKGFKIFFVNVQEDKRKVEMFRNKMQIKGPIILDSKGYLASKYRIFGIPAYIFLKDAQEIGRSSFINQKQLEALYNEY